MSCGVVTEHSPHIWVPFLFPHPIGCDGGPRRVNAYDRCVEVMAGKFLPKDAAGEHDPFWLAEIRDMLDALLASGLVVLS